MNVEKLNDLIFIAKYWGYEDEMKRLIPLCPVADGRAIYRRAALRYRTKWLIIQDNLKVTK